MHYTMFTQFNKALLERGIEGAAEYARGLGFVGVEPQLGDLRLFPSADDAKRAREVLEARGLKVTCCSMSVLLYRNPQAVENAKKQAEIAAALGSPYLHHTLLPWLELKRDLPPFREALYNAVEGAAQIAEYAAGLGVTCLYEDQGMYINGVENFGTFYEEMQKRCGNIGVCADFGNIQFVDERAEDFIDAFAGEIRHVHIKDYIRKSGTMTPGMYWYRTKNGHWIRDTMIGSGATRFEVCIRSLQNTGYKGAYSLELCHPEPYEAGVKQAMDYLDRVDYVLNY